MSAYVMELSDIERLGRFADDNTPGHGDMKGLFVYRKGRPYADNYMSGQRVAEALLRENVRSVNYRYSTKDHVPKIKVANIKGKQSIKTVSQLLGCWNYQACERKDFKRSEAYEVYVQLLVLALEVAAVQLTEAGID